MDEKGIVIAGLGLLVGIVLFLVAGWVVLTFFKNLIFFALGIGILWFAIVIVPQLTPGKDVLRNVAMTAMVGAVVLLIAFVPGLPFALVGQEGYVPIRPGATTCSPYGYQYQVVNSIISETQQFEMRAGIELDQSLYVTSNCCTRGYSLTASIGSETIAENVGMKAYGCGSPDGPTPYAGVTTTIPLEAFGDLKGKHILRLTEPESGSSVDVEIWIDPVECILREQEMVIAETFAAGTTLTVTDLRFNAKAFCSQLPILVTEQDRVVEQKLEEYDLLQNSFLTIPDGQTWTFFYITEINPDITVICREGIYDVDLEQCIVSPGIVHVCSQGVFDSELGLCIVQPEARYVCEIGYLDLESNKCVYVVPEDEVTPVCPEDSRLVVDDEGVKMCIFEPDIEPLCTKGNYNAETETCQYYPDTEEVIGFIQTALLVAALVSITAIAAYLAVRGFK